MSYILLFCVALLSIHAVQSSVILTAKVADLQNVVEQLVNSPVVDRAEAIWRRASDQFRRHSRRQSRRADGTLEGKEVEHEAGLPERRSKFDEDLITLGKNASLYLKKIRRMLDGL